MQHSLYSDFFISLLLKFFSALDFYWVQSPNEVAERAVGCDDFLWILEILSLNCSERSQCCFSALCEVKILCFSLILNMGSTGSSWGPYQGIILHRTIEPQVLSDSSPASYSLKVPCNYIDFTS